MIYMIRKGNQYIGIIFIIIVYSFVFMGFDIKKE